MFEIYTINRYIRPKTNTPFICKLNSMNKGQFLHIITSLWKLCGVHTLILLKITMILKSCLINSICA